MKTCTKILLHHTMPRQVFSSLSSSSGLLPAYGRSPRLVEMSQPRGLPPLQFPSRNYITKQLDSIIGRLDQRCCIHVILSPAYLRAPQMNIPIIHSSKQTASFFHPQFQTSMLLASISHTIFCSPPLL